MKNPPAFQFYPQDFLSDVNVITMNMEERGAYWTLCCICWIEDGIKISKAEALLKHSLSTDEAKVKVLSCFHENNGILRHKRLDQERKKQVEFREKKVLAGLKGVEIKRHKAHLKHRLSIPKASVKHNLSSSSSSSSSKDIPPIPKDFAFKVKDELGQIKRTIKENERLLKKPEQIKRKQTKDGRQLTPEILKEGIEAMKKEYRQMIEDYS